MTNLERLRKKVLDYKEDIQKSILVAEANLEEQASFPSEIEDLMKKMEIYNKDNVPSRIKTLAPAQRDMWVTTFNKTFQEAKDYGIAFSEANASIREGYVPKQYLKKVNLTPKEKEAASGKKLSESITAELKEAGIKITKPAKTNDIEILSLMLKESTFDEASGEIEAILIEQGTSQSKRRHYPFKTIEEAAPFFSGLKMYMNHQTKKEEKERPERNLKDYVSTITESRYEDGKAIGKITVHDPWLRECLRDPTFRANVGLSINTGGQVSYGKVNGQEMQIVEKIIFARQNGPVSVDWVTEAGARGRVDRHIRESKKGGSKMELNEATITDIKAENPQLMKDIVAEVTTSIKESDAAVKKEAELKEAQDKLKAFELKETITKQKASIATALKDVKLRDVTKIRIAETLAAREFKTDADLQVAIKESVKSELAYIAQFSGKGKIDTGSGANKSENETLIEKQGKDLLESSGYGEPEKKEGEE